MKVSIFDQQYLVRPSNDNSIALLDISQRCVLFYKDKILIERWYVPIFDIVDYAFVDGLHVIYVGDNYPKSYVYDLNKKFVRSSNWHEDMRRFVARSIYTENTEFEYMSFDHPDRVLVTCRNETCIIYLDHGKKIKEFMISERWQRFIMSDGITIASWQWVNGKTIVRFC